MASEQRCGAMPWIRGGCVLPLGHTSSMHSFPAAPDPLDPAATKGAEWPRIALCAVHEEWWPVEKFNDENCPYPGCSGPVTIYAAEEPHRA